MSICHVGRVANPTIWAPVITLLYQYYNHFDKILLDGLATRPT